MPMFEYDVLVNLYESLFGKDNVHVVLFEDMIYDRDSFFNNLCDVLGISSYIPKITSINLNAGPERNIFLKLRRFQNVTMSTRMHPDAMLPYIPLGLLSLGRRFNNDPKDAIKRYKQFYGKDAIEEIIRFYSESNGRLASKLDRDIVELGFIT